MTKSTLLSAMLLLATVLHAQDNPGQPGNGSLSPFGFGGGDCNPQMAAIGCYETRVAGTAAQWVVEPTEGKFEWEKLDKEMSDLAASHIRPGGWLIGGNWGADGKPAVGLPVKDLPAFGNYVTQVVKHVGGKIKYWEVWNEPPNGLNHDTSVEYYAKTMVCAYDAAKAADPECLVGMAASSLNINFLNLVIQAGAKDHFDYITVHPYEVLGGVIETPGTEAVFMSIVPSIRKMLAAQNPAKAKVPIILTELGCDANRVGAKVQGEAIVKAYVMGIAQGITCIHWFQGRDAGGNGGMGMITADGTPRPAYSAMAQMIKLLGQHPTYLGLTLLNDKDYGFVFQGANGPVLACWTSSKTPDHIDFGKEVQIVDPSTGNTTSASSYDLTLAPILVTDLTNTIVEQSKANPGKPFPWNGDFTDAKSVSITMGVKNVEKGLHTRAGDAIAKDVIAYGNGARPGNFPGGNVFMVDPNFLSYTSTPIEISVVARRDPENHPADIKLKYEYSGPGNYKTLPGKEVPDKKDWSTLTWRLDDAQFVSLWGFNFYYDAGSAYVQSVTVTKLDR